MDSRKKDNNNLNNAYGDLVIWKEIIKFAKNTNKDIIFVSSDRKDDWWNILLGKTIGPRVELRKEFSNETDQRFHMYEMSNFINQYETYSGDEISGVIKQEIETKSDNNTSLPFKNKDIFEVALDSIILNRSMTESENSTVTIGDIHESLADYGLHTSGYMENDLKSPIKKISIKKETGNVVYDLKKNSKEFVEFSKENKLDT